MIFECEWLKRTTTPYCVLIKMEKDLFFLGILPNILYPILRPHLEAHEQLSPEIFTLNVAGRIDFVIALEVTSLYYASRLKKFI